MEKIDLKGMEFEFLQEFRMKQYLKLVDLNLEGDGKKDQADSLRAFIATLDAECKSREKLIGASVTKKESTKTDGVANNFLSHQIKGMSHVISNEVPIFSSGQDVHIWLNKLESYWKLYVATDTTGLMEKHFIQSAKSRLCSEYLHAMLGSASATDTFEQMKDYMKKNHASKITVFQILDTLWGMDQKDSENFRDFGIRLDDKANEAKNIIFAKFKEWAESNEESATEMKADDIFKLVSGQVFLQNLKNKHGVVYNNICNDLDKTWSANEIALKAMTFSDRMASSEDSRNQGSVPDAFTVQRGKNSNSNSNKGSRNQNNSRNSNNPRQDKQNCWNFTITGKCTRDKCPFFHSREEQKLYRELKDRENKKGGNTGKDAKPQGGNDKNAKNGNQGGTQHASYAAAVSEAPMIPLPTQNFLH